MYPVRIFGIAPYPGLESIMQRLAAQRPDIQLITAAGSLRNWRQALNSIPASSYDVIVSRGGTARMLTRYARVPVVEISTGVYDMLCTLRNTQNYAGRIAVVGYPNITERARQLAELMQYDITVFTIEQQEDVQTLLPRLKQEGWDLILGDNTSQRYAQELGMNSMLITSSEASVQDAFNEAVRLVRAQNNFVLQNELFRQIIRSEWDELVVFHPNGDILYSTRPENEESREFYDLLRRQLPPQDRLPIETECELEKSYWHVSGQLLHIQQTPAIALRLKKSRFPAADAGSGVFLSRQNDPASSVQGLSVAAFVGKVASTLGSYAAAPFPVLLLGEEGTGKDYAAAQLSRSSANRQNALITLDCQTVCKRQWKQLLESEDSPLLRVGWTLYFKNVHCLSNEQAEALFQFMENSCSHRRNRMLFSALSSAAEDYCCHYLQGHFSTLVLRLPPLRERREDIPNLLALCINQLNILLGKQVAGFTEDALEQMVRFPWEGNLAQLDRVVRTLVVEAQTPYIDAGSVTRQLRRELPCSISAPVQQNGYYSINLQQSLADIEYDVVRLVLQEENNNQSQTAKRLKMGRSTLWNLLKKRQA